MTIAGQVTVAIDVDKGYDIEQVATFTGYSTGYLRTLEKEEKIPKSSRDKRGWRYWFGSDVIKIVAYKEKHTADANPKDR